LPTVLPVTDQKVKAVRIDSHARLETDAQIAIVHLILLHVGMEQAKVARNGEEEVIVERRELRQFILE
jgi:hypothetical protein